MAVFEYKALNENGRLTRGIIDASSTEEARDKLRVQSLFPVEVTTSTTAPSGHLFPIFRRISGEDISLFTRQLASLLKGGLPLLPSLDAIAEQMDSHPLKKIVAGLAESVKEGKSFGEALSSFDRIFSSIYVNMVKSGEVAGSLSDILFRISALIRESITLRSKIKNALTYPLVVGGVSVGVLVFLLIIVIPTLSTWDAAIDQTAELIDAKRKLKKGLAQQLLTGKRRLPGFVEAWVKHEFGQIATVSKKRFDPKNGNEQRCVELDCLSQGDGRLLGSIGSRG
ncbi:MAG TPA: hypothetical protein EYP78_06115, partial [Candidatus Omnitrophica bacterium]|nr:hypothetical protein [Candidatus Omnitrophota bacterium]